MKKNPFLILSNKIIIFLLIINSSCMFKEKDKNQSSKYFIVHDNMKVNQDERLNEILEKIEIGVQNNNPEVFSYYLFDYFVKYPCEALYYEAKINDALKGLELKCESIISNEILMKFEGNVDEMTKSIDYAKEIFSKCDIRTSHLLKNILYDINFYYAK